MAQKLNENYHIGNYKEIDVIISPTPLDLDVQATSLSMAKIHNYNDFNWHAKCNFNLTICMQFLETSKPYPAMHFIK